MSEADFWAKLLGDAEAWRCGAGLIASPFCSSKKIETHNHLSQGPMDDTFEYYWTVWCILFDQSHAC